VVWRIGGALLEIPQPPACVGVAPQGLNLGSVQPLPQLILGPLRDFTCLVKCLRGLVRAKVPAPNAPNDSEVFRFRNNKYLRHRHTAMTPPLLYHSMTRHSFNDTTLPPLYRPGHRHNTLCICCLSCSFPCPPAPRVYPLPARTSRRLRGGRRLAVTVTSFKLAGGCRGP
jgi:hypothetical protein